MRVQFKTGAEISAKDLEENFTAYNKLTGDDKYPFIYFAEDGSTIYTEDARQYSRDNEDGFPKLCIAVVVKTLAHKLVANFYLRFNRPKCLFKVFDDMDAAEAWCKEQYEIAIKQESV
ncbi:MAG: hypothetical protein JST26_06430 [Bacteroidetes bacterium]|nr:hypothetical protein [Bacteroidota bacterium]